MLERFNLLNHARGDERIAVTAVDDGDARVAVEIFFARAVEKILHVAAHELRRVAVKMSETGHDVFALFLQDFFCADVIFQVNHSTNFFQA